MHTDEERPRTADGNGERADAQKPRLECDLVMKGGITSGIVYPPLVLELHKNGYRFRNIGGTSAGAIAAAVTAAAECGREVPGHGFSELERVSERLRREGFVRDLFQPTGGTRPLMETIFALKDWPAADREAARATLLGRWFPGLREHPVSKAVRFGKRLNAVLAQKSYDSYKFGLDLGDIFGVMVALLFALVSTFVFLVADVYLIDSGSLFPGWVYVVVFFLNYIAFAVPFGWLGRLVGRLAGGVQDLSATLTSGVPKNFFGLCSGLRAEDVPAHRPVLTQWLHDSIQGLSGRDAAPEKRPLTFGDLWRWPAPGEGEDVEKRRGRRIDLRMVTANLSQNQPYVLPFERDDLFIFNEADLKRLFPEDVVTYLIQKGAERVCEGVRLPDGFHFLPQARDLPVILATRMSLSFPVLISMIPLYTISDAAFGDKKVRIEVIPKWPEGPSWEGVPRQASGRTPRVPAHRQAEWELETEETIRLREESGGEWVAPREPHVLERGDLQRNWFSDGGICSNFPIHFFDAWLPTRPTFGVNLTSQMGAEPPPADLARGMADAAGRATLGERLATGDAAGAEQRERTIRSRSSVAAVQCAAKAKAAPERAAAGDSGYVHLPRPDEVIRPEWIPIGGLFKFLTSIFTTAQNYRDNMQAALPSYRERIIQVRLTDREGGLNLDMPKEVLDGVAEKGALAGRKLCEFDKETHQWVRFRVLMKQMESQLIEMHRVINDEEFYRRIINRDEKFDAGKFPYVPEDFEMPPPEAVGWRQEMVAQLLEMGRVIDKLKPGDLFAREPQPLPEPVLRVTPRI